MNNCIFFSLSTHQGDGFRRNDENANFSTVETFISLEHDVLNYTLTHMETHQQRPREMHAHMLTRAHMETHQQREMLSIFPTCIRARPNKTTHKTTHDNTMASASQESITQPNDYAKTRGRGLSQ